MSVCCQVGPKCIILAKRENICWLPFCLLPGDACSKYLWSFQRFAEICWHVSLFVARRGLNTCSAVCKWFSLLPGKRNRRRQSLWANCNSILSSSFNCRISAHCSIESWPHLIAIFGLQSISRCLPGWPYQFCLLKCFDCSLFLHCLLNWPCFQFDCNIEFVYLDKSFN